MKLQTGKCKPRMQGLGIRWANWMLVALIVCVLTGCGGATFVGDKPPKGIEPLEITSVSPVAAVQGGPAFTLSVTGAYFPANCYIEWLSQSSGLLALLKPTYVSSNELTVQVPANLIATPGPMNIIVINLSNEQRSNVFPFAIQPPAH